jgi:integrase
MGRKRTPGLIKRGEIWHIEKEIRGYGRLRGSCGTSDLEEAERYLARRLEEIRKALVYGVRPTRSFRDAATKYLREGMHKRAIGRDAQDLKTIEPYIGDLPLQQVHHGTLQKFVEDRRKQGRRNGTINRTLAVVRRVLNLAARLWRDENGLSWLETAPMIQLLPPTDKRKPYPLSWEEQRLLFRQLPKHLHEMALYKCNTGCREQEVCQLQWAWEVPVPELDTSVFEIPEWLAKNGVARYVVLNSIARRVVEAQRGVHPEYVFTLDGKPLTKIYNSGWKRAREAAAEAYPEEFGTPAPEGFRNVRVHDLKHTFGRRLRRAGVSFEDRQDLLGHKAGRVTTEYSAAEIEDLISAAERAAVEPPHKSPTMRLVQDRKNAVSA